MMSLRSRLVTFVPILLIIPILIACSNSNPAQKREQEADQQVNTIQQKTDPVQQSVQQSEQRLNDAEQQANPKQ
ncbi:MAG: hypothetical protein NW220_23475 [Leptolyngbyaceae cyanobacterium bins.349]|nr:hypothetical protein [Leptolyngbyaceae cyanobacterium bins.349]